MQFLSISQRRKGFAEGDYASLAEREMSVPASCTQKDLFARSGTAWICPARACYGRQVAKSRFAKCGLHSLLPRLV